MGGYVALPDAFVQTPTHAAPWVAAVLSGRLHRRLQPGAALLELEPEPLTSTLDHVGLRCHAVEPIDRIGIDRTYDESEIQSRIPVGDRWVPIDRCHTNREMLAVGGGVEQETSLTQALGVNVSKVARGNRVVGELVAGAHDEHLASDGVMRPGLDNSLHGVFHPQPARPCCLMERRREHRLHA